MLDIVKGVRAVLVLNAETFQEEEEEAPGPKHSYQSSQSPQTSARPRGSKKHPMPGTPKARTDFRV